MEYKTGKFSLNQEQQELRIKVVKLIRDAQEKGMTSEEITQAMQFIDEVIDYKRFEKRDELSELFFDDLQNVRDRKED